MGKARARPEYWVAVVRPGNILFELDGVPESVAKESLRLAPTSCGRTRFLMPPPRSRRGLVHFNPATDRRHEGQRIIELSNDDLHMKRRS